MSVPTSTSDFWKLYEDRLPYLEEIIGPDNWPEIDQQWESLYQVRSSNKKIREDFILYGGLGMFKQMGENTNVDFDSMVQGPTKTLLHSLFGLGFSIGLLAREHDLDGIMAKYGGELSRSARMTIQSIAAEIWNGAFDTYLTADGEHIFDTTHTYIRAAGTWANKPNPAVGISRAAIESALTAFRRMKDPMGNPMPLRATRLIIPPELKFLCEEILKSSLRHDTTTNATNVLKDILTIFDWEWITSGTQWIIAGPKEQVMSYWYWNIRPRTSHGFEFDNEAMKTKMLFSCSQGVISPYGLYGSEGA